MQIGIAKAGLKLPLPLHLEAGTGGVDVIRTSQLAVVAKTHGRSLADGGGQAQTRLHAVAIQLRAFDAVLCR